MLGDVTAIRALYDVWRHIWRRHTLSYVYVMNNGTLLMALEDEMVCYWLSALDATARYVTVLRDRWQVGEYVYVTNAATLMTDEHWLLAHCCYHTPHTIVIRYHDIRQLLASAGAGYHYWR